jgi:hypothetical protein
MHPVRYLWPAMRTLKLASILAVAALVFAALAATAQASRAPTEAEQSAAAPVLKAFTENPALVATAHTECRYSLTAVSTVDQRWSLARVECFYPEGGGWDGVEVLLYEGRVIDDGTSELGCDRTPWSVLKDLHLFNGGCSCGFERRHHAFSIRVLFRSTSCKEADAVTTTLYFGNRGRARCYRSYSADCKNGVPADLANSIWLIKGWSCGVGAGGAGCKKGHKELDIALSAE